MVIRAVRFAFLALCVFFLALGVVIFVFGAYLLSTGGSDADGARGSVGALAAVVGLLVAGYAVFAIRMTRR